MPYTAKAQDVESLFIAAQMPMYVCIFFNLNVNCANSYLDSERIDIAIDPFTGRNPSYCFVDLQNKDHAERAMTELDGTNMLGRPVKIKPGVAKSQERINNPPSPFRVEGWREQSKPSFAKVNSDSSSRVYVGGLPRLTEHEVVQSNIESFFKDFKV
jgi:RNA recognition motif-containing protein